MRFEVKTGRALEKDFVVTIVIDERNNERSSKKLVLVIAAVALVGVVVSAGAYGAVSGDYTLLRGIAEAGRDLLAKAASSLIASK